MLTLLDSAIQLATRAHAGQMDEDDMPHIVHCFEVMLRVSKWCEDHQNATRYSNGAGNALAKYTLEELLIASILHDAPEDSFENKTALEHVDLNLVEARFGKNVRTLVDGVTRRIAEDGTKEFYRDFIYRAKKDPGTALIKSADLEHNYSRSWKIKKATWRNKLAFKYSTAIQVLSEEDLTWEQASHTVAYEGPHALYTMADPNGKKIDVTEEEFKSLIIKKKT